MIKVKGEIIYPIASNGAYITMDVSFLFMSLIRDFAMRIQLHLSQNPADLL